MPRRVSARRRPCPSGGLFRNSGLINRASPLLCNILMVLQSVVRVKCHCACLGPTQEPMDRLINQVRPSHNYCPIMSLRIDVNPAARIARHRLRPTSCAERYGRAHPHIFHNSSRTNRAPAKGDRASGYLSYHRPSCIPLGHPFWRESNGLLTNVTTSGLNLRNRLNPPSVGTFAPSG